MRPETVVCWKWRPGRGYRSTFSAETVNVLRAMVARHYAVPHRFVCVTDDATGLDPRIEVMPAWDDFAGVPSPHGPQHPSCYRRLRLFHPDAAQWFGPRVVSLDLDCVIVGDLVPLWDRLEPIVLWGETNPTTAYNGSMILLTPGARPDVWTDFDPERSPQRAKASGCHGSDQGWISYRLGSGEARWGLADGVYSYRKHLQMYRDLPANARIVFFHGATDPWSPVAQSSHAWVRRHWVGEPIAEAV